MVGKIDHLVSKTDVCTVPVRLCRTQQHALPGLCRDLVIGVFFLWHGSLPPASFVYEIEKGNPHFATPFEGVAFGTESFLE